MIELAPSSFYYKPRLDRAQREQMETELRDKIEDVQKIFTQAGYRTVGKYLAKSGVRVGERRLRTVMGKYGLWAKVKRAFVVTTDSKHDFQLYPNLISGMCVTGVDQVWATDITYIRIKNGFVFLAVVIDLFSRRVIGWSISKKIDTNLSLNALRMAIRRRKPKPGVIHHSDRGVQYVSDRYVRLLKRLGFHLSNSAPGNPYDNAFVERFMRTLKQEEIYLANYETYLDVVENLPVFIEEIYNEKRVHSSLDYLTPNELEAMVANDPTTAGPFTLTL